MKRAVVVLLVLMMAGFAGGQSKQQRPKSAECQEKYFQPTKLKGVGLIYEVYYQTTNNQCGLTVSEPEAKMAISEEAKYTARAFRRVRHGQELLDRKPSPAYRICLIVAMRDDLDFILSNSETVHKEAQLSMGKEALQKLDQNLQQQLLEAATKMPSDSELPFGWCAVGCGGEAMTNMDGVVRLLRARAKALQ